MAQAVAKPSLVEPEPVKKPVVTGKRERFQEIQFVVRTWHLMISNDVQPEHLLQPSFWKPIASRLRLLDVVVVTNDALTLRAEFEVIESNPAGSYARVRELSKREFSAPGAPPEESGEYRIVHAGAFEKWQIVRIADGTVMKSKIETRDDARYVLSSEIIGRNGPSHIR